MQNDLTPEQSEALNLKEGVIVAGAGAGKTKTMIAKIMHDQANLVRPEDQIVITFTTSAALEMESRLTRAGGQKPRHIGTLHSLAFRYISAAWGGKIGVLTDRGFDAVIKAGLKRCKINVTLPTAKDWIMSPPKSGNGVLFRKAILAEMKGQRVVHPDTMLVIFLELTRERPETADVRVYFDEGQDASQLDLGIVQNLARSGQNRGSLLIFGDPRQSIYEFRGVDPAIFERTVRDFGDGVVCLTSNFRSTRAIVEEANKIAALMPNPTGMVQPMVAVRDSRLGPINRSPGLGSTEMEASRMADDISRRLDMRETVAVLTRYNATADVVAAMLRGQGLAVERSGREVPKHPALEALRALHQDDIPTGGWESMLMYLGVPFAYQDSLAKALVGVTSQVEIGPLIDEVLGQPADGKSVWVSTIHAAKGLEWDHVHLVGADSLSLDPTIPEDVRLAYVAVTRARDTFSVSSARNRAGDRRVDGLKPSPIFFE